MSSLRVLEAGFESILTPRQEGRRARNRKEKTERPSQSGYDMRKKETCCHPKIIKRRQVVGMFQEEGFSARKSRAVLRKWNARLRCSTNEVDSATADRLFRPVALVSTFFRACFRPRNLAVATFQNHYAEGPQLDSLPAPAKASSHC